MSALAALRKVCGDQAVREADERDAIDGVRPLYVAAPASADETRELMRVATDHGLTVVVRGAGTKIDWGNPPRAVDLVVSTERMSALLEHAAGDLVVRVQPGLRLADLAAALAPAGQRLSVDETVPGATVGGTVATGAAGPIRMLHGSVRDLLIGVTVVRADGTVARSGGKVVKNVAGYDLGKLYTGSYGTLGVITEAIFRLHPLPTARAVVSTRFDSEDAAAPVLAEVIGSRLVPTAVEVDRPATDAPLTVSVLLEGVPPGVAARAEAARSMLGADATVSDELPEGWARYPFTGDATGVKLTVPIAHVPDLLTAVREAAAPAGLPVAVRGSAGVGALYAGLPGECAPDEVARFVATLRRFVTRYGGSVVVLRAPAQVKSAVDVWGPVAGLDLMRRLKGQFDPDHRLAPGRFVGGI